MPRRLGALLLAMALSLPPASRALAAEIAGPQLDAAALRAARAATPGPQLRFIFDLHLGAAAAVPLSVQLGADYVDIVEGQRETLYDFQLRRRLSLDRTAQLFANFSLYGDVAFRRFELGKRESLAEMFGEANPGEALPLSLQPFWVESDVGMRSDAKQSPAIKQEKLGDGAVRFSLGGEQVALFAPATQAVPAELRRSFARFLRLRLPIHPDILAAVTLDGRLPKRLVLVSAAGGDRQPLGLVLKAIEPAEAGYPLPAGFLSRPLAGRAEDSEAVGLRALLPEMLDAVAARHGGGPRTLSDYRHAADQALRGGQGFAATLLLAEAALQYGTDAGACVSGPGWGSPCRDAGELGRILAADPRAALFYKARTAEPKDPAEAVALWEGLKRDDVANGYVVDAFLADRLSAGGHRQEAMGAFSRALAGDPYLVGVYKEMGDHFLRASRTDLAWTCYDLGRALPGRKAGDALAPVDALERDLAAGYPEFF